MQEYLEAFYSLSSKRSAGFSSENPISTTDIVAYLQLYPTDNIDLFTYLISEMDSEYLQVRYSDKPSPQARVETEIIETNETMTGNKF